jgi:3-oxoacyl-[acyl-carrier-protein] synthase III
MIDQSTNENSTEEIHSFFEQPQVRLLEIPVARGVPLGVQTVSNERIGIGGAYGTWGHPYDNLTLPEMVEKRTGTALSNGERMDLEPLGFVARHHQPDLSVEESVELEVEIGAQFLRAAAGACGWSPEEVDGVLIGTSGPIVEDYTVRIAQEAGIRDDALKVSVHKACDGSVGALHLLLNENLEINKSSGINLAQELAGKKVLVGGIEGLSRLVQLSKDKNALQLFGNGAGVIGLVPGESMQFLVGKSHEVFDSEGVLAVHMFYPHSRLKTESGSNIEVSQAGSNHIRVAGLMNEPADGDAVSMAGPMGMVKLFVRTGVQVVRDVFEMYQDLRSRVDGIEAKKIAVAIVHHANLKINRLKEKHLQNEGIQLPMPWLLSEFGNVSAASNMIAFLRQLPRLNPGDHVLIDGFGAGTYYDVLVVALRN